MQGWGTYSAVGEEKKPRTYKNLLPILRINYKI